MPDNGRIPFPTGRLNLNRNKYTSNPRATLQRIAIWCEPENTKQFSCRFFLIGYLVLLFLGAASRLSDLVVHEGEVDPVQHRHVLPHVHKQSWKNKDADQRQGRGRTSVYSLVRPKNKGAYYHRALLRGMDEGGALCLRQREIWRHHHLARSLRDNQLCRNWTGFVPADEAPFTQDAQHDAQHNAGKWDLLSSMGVFTLHASNIKGFAFQFACASRSASCVNLA